MRTVLSQKLTSKVGVGCTSFKDSEFSSGAGHPKTRVNLAYILRRGAYFHKGDYGACVSEIVSFFLSFHSVELL